MAVQISSRNPDEIADELTSIRNSVRRGSGVRDLFMEGKEDVRKVCILGSAGIAQYS